MNLLCFSRKQYVSLLFERSWKGSLSFVMLGFERPCMLCYCKYCQVIVGRRYQLRRAVVEGLLNLPRCHLPLFMQRFFSVLRAQRIYCRRVDFSVRFRVGHFPSIRCAAPAVVIRLSKLGYCTVCS